LIYKIHFSDHLETISLSKSQKVFQKNSWPSVQIQIIEIVIDSSVRISTATKADVSNQRNYILLNLRNIAVLLLKMMLSLFWCQAYFFYS